MPPKGIMNKEIFFVHILLWQVVFVVPPEPGTLFFEHVYMVLEIAGRSLFANSISTQASNHIIATVNNSKNSNDSTFP